MVPEAVQRQPAEVQRIVVGSALTINLAVKRFRL